MKAWLAVADFALKCVSIAAIIVGGYWAYWKFDIARNDAENVELAVTTEALPYEDNLALLVIHLKAHNIGKVLSIPKAYYVDIRQIPEHVQRWNAIDLSKIRPTATINILKDYPAGYEMEPGVKYDDVETVVLPRGIRVDVRGEYDFSGGSSVNADTVIKVGSAEN